MTWPEWLRSRGASADAVRLMTAGGDSSDLSALYVLRQLAMLRRSTQRYKIQGGMDLLPRAMASALGDIVYYGAPVVRVTRRSAAVPGLRGSSKTRFRVDYRSSARIRSLTASRVIFAVPFTTLRDIEVRPRLSRQKEQAIAQLSYYNSVRFLLQAKSRFWSAADLNGSARTDRATETWDSTFEQTATRRGILAVNAGGKVDRASADLSPDERMAFGIRLAADAFPGIGSQVETGVVQQWASEPWSRGAFAVFGPGQMSALMPSIAGPEQGLHFAGEHTSAWTGWMEGALLSGERVAREVLSS
jgi:monoamine oxidase